MILIEFDCLQRKSGLRLHRPVRHGVKTPIRVYERRLVAHPPRIVMGMQERDRDLLKSGHREPGFVWDPSWQELAYAPRAAYLPCKAFIVHVFKSSVIR